MKPFRLILAPLLLGVSLLGACATERIEGAAVPTGSDAIRIAGQQCPDPFRQRKGRWTASFHDGVWKVSRDSGKQWIRIDAMSGKSEPCHSI